jgi:hypothetical protein
MIDKILEKTRPLMQFFGTDVISQLSKVYEERGLGNLFDPNPEATKRYGQSLYKETKNFSI